MTTREKIIAILRMQFGDDSSASGDFSDDERFGYEIDADSLDMLELAMAFEEEFGLVIPDDDLDEIKTVGDAVTYVEKRV